MRKTEKQIKTKQSLPLREDGMPDLCDWQKEKPETEQSEGLDITKVLTAKELDILEKTRGRISNYQHTAMMFEMLAYHLPEADEES